MEMSVEIEPAHPMEISIRGFDAPLTEIEPAHPMEISIRGFDAPLTAMFDQKVFQFNGKQQC